MREDLLGTLFVLAVTAAVGLALSAFFVSMAAWQQRRPDVTRYVDPFWRTFDASLFTEAGNRLRKTALRINIGALVAVGVAAILGARMPACDPEQDHVGCRSATKDRPSVAGADSIPEFTLATVAGLNTDALASVAASAMLREALSLPHPPGITREPDRFVDAAADSANAKLRAEIVAAFGPVDMSGWPRRFDVSLDVPHLQQRLTALRAAGADSMSPRPGVTMPDSTMRPLSAMERLCWDVDIGASCRQADAAAKVVVHTIDVTDGGRDASIEFDVSVATLETARPGTVRVGAGGAGYGHQIRHRYRFADGQWSLVEARILGIYN